MTYNNALKAYEAKGGLKDVVSIMFSHYSITDRIWYLVSDDHRLLATYCNNKLETQ